MKKKNKIPYIERRYTSPFSNFQRKSLATVLCLMKNILGLGLGNDCNNFRNFRNVLGNLWTSSDMIRSSPKILALTGYKSHTCDFKKSWQVY